VGGGLSVLQAHDVVLISTEFMNCFAYGIAQATNVFVSGGGIFTRASQSLRLENTSVSASGIGDVFSTDFLQSGGGAMGVQNVASVCISNSRFYNNSDASLTGVVFVQQLNKECSMDVKIINGSVLATSPFVSIDLPSLNISCGVNCSEEQQKRIRIDVVNSILVSWSKDQEHRSSIVMSLPKFSRVMAERSFVKCQFKGSSNLAVLTTDTSHPQSLIVSCAPCEKPFEIALTSTSFDLRFLSAFRQRKSCRALNLASKSSPLTQRCPFGISFCSTVVKVTSGFWVTFTADGSISSAIYCPSNYCGCRNQPDSLECQLFPVFATEFREYEHDILCQHNRTGVLCGGCKPDFTQSLNGYSCIPNDVCQSNLGMLWTVTVIGYLIYSIYIVSKSLKTKSDGLIMCVLFYGQISSFATIPPILKAQRQNSAQSIWFSKITRFESVLSLFENTCYGPNMGGYEATLAQLSGPAIVVVLSLVMCDAASRLQRRFDNFFRKYKLEIRASFGVTMTNVLLLLFSSVTSVVFQLITCVDAKISTEGTTKVVFIDGTKTCSGTVHNIFIAVAALLFVVLLAFCAVLKFKKIDAQTQAIVCSAYTDTRYYWIAIKLVYRFIVTVISATVPQNPSVSAMALSLCTMCMLALIIALRPYVSQRTHYMDMFCYICLIIQFLLQCVARASESMGFSITEDNVFFESVSNAAAASIFLRSVFRHQPHMHMFKWIHSLFRPAGTYPSQLARYCFCWMRFVLGWWQPSKSGDRF
jgi:hypothetical protein